jgi:cobalt-zinc-cadmium efflux system outer membrane protein
MGIFVVTALLESSCISVYTAVLRYSCLESAPSAHHCQQHLSLSFFSRIGFLGLVVLLFLVASPLAFGKLVKASLAKPITAGLVVVDTFKPLTLEQTFQLVMEQNPKVKALQAQNQVSKAQLVTANARLNPSIMSDNGVAERTYRLGVQHTFELGGKRNNRVAVANAQQAATGFDVQRQLLDVRAEVRKTYTQVFNLQERQTVTQEILAKAQQLLEVTTKREKAGDVAALDVLQAEMVMVNARNELQLVAYQVVEARNRLNTLLNQPLGTSLQLAAPATSKPILTAPQKSGTMTSPVSPSASTEISVEQFVVTATSNRPEVQQNLNALTVVEKQLVLAKSNRIPNLTIATGFDKTTGEGGQNSIFAMGNLELPLFNRQQGPIKEALAKKAQLEAEQQTLKNQLSLEVTNAYTAVQAHQQRVANYETQLLPKANQLVEKARRSFEEGKVSVLTPINAQQAFINNHLGYLQAMQDLQNAISDLERAIGVAL